MGPSVPWNETVSLGQKLIHEWEDRPTLMTRWMAHRIAELMQAADDAETEEERESAQSKCTDLILRLWERRKHWPYGDPLQRVSETISAIVGEPNFNEPSEPNQPSPSGKWESVFQEVQEHQRQEILVLLYAMSASMKLEPSKDWLEDHGGLMAPKEKDLLDLFISLYEESSEEDFELGFIEAPNFATRPSEKRHKLVKQSLEDLSKWRMSLLDDISEGGESDGESEK